MRNKYRFEPILNRLKLLLQMQDGTIYLVNYGKTHCLFNNPATPEQIEVFQTETGLFLPDDYQRFLQYHNGGELFNQVCSLDQSGDVDVGGGIKIYSIEEVRDYYEKMPSELIPIAEYCDLKVILDFKRYQSGTQNYILIGRSGEPVHEALKIHCNFDLWLERIMLTGGELFWEWAWYTADNFEFFRTQSKK